MATTCCNPGEASPAAVHQRHGPHLRASAARRVPWCQAAARVNDRTSGGATTCIGPIVGPAGIGWLAQSPHAHTAHMHAYLLTSTVCDSSTARSVDASPVSPRSLSDDRMHLALELDDPIGSSLHCADMHALEHVDVRLALRHPRTGTSATVGPARRAVVPSVARRPRQCTVALSRCSPLV